MPGEAHPDLVDGEREHAAAPNAFSIPLATHRAGLTPGRLVQVGLRGGGAAARVWVQVDAVAPGGRYTGTLQGDPGGGSRLVSGDEITFDPRHVLAIEYLPGELGFDPEQSAAVDPRILQSGVPATRVVWFQPPNLPEPVWFLGLDGGMPQEAILVPLGRLAERWPELAPVFASRGGDWLRDPEHPAYLADSLEHQREVATAALADAAGLVLRSRRDPAAAEAEAHFETVLEAVLELHWSGKGRLDGIAHRGFSREDGRVRLGGVARVREGADRPISVDVSPTAPGTISVDRPAKPTGVLRRRKPASGLQAPGVGTQLIRVMPSGLAVGRLTAGEDLR